MKLESAVSQREYRFSHFGLKFRVRFFVPLKMRNFLWFPHHILPPKTAGTDSHNPQCWTSCDWKMRFLFIFPSTRWLCLFCPQWKWDYRALLPKREQRTRVLEETQLITTLWWWVAELNGSFHWQTTKHCVRCLLPAFIIWLFFWFQF